MLDPSAPPHQNGTIPVFASHLSQSRAHLSQNPPPCFFLAPVWSGWCPLSEGSLKSKPITNYQKEKAGSEMSCLFLGIHAQSPTILTVYLLPFSILFSLSFFSSFLLPPLPPVRFHCYILTTLLAGIKILALFAGLSSLMELGFDTDFRFHKLLYTYASHWP